MPWKVRDVMDEKIDFVLQAVRQDESFSSLCRNFGISRPTGYLWLQRYRENHSLTTLQNRSSRPEHTPTKCDPATEARVVALRQQYSWGARKIQVLLAREGIQATVITINRIIARHHLVNDIDSHSHATQRFAYEQPNTLWQMDLKSPLKVRDGQCLPLSIIDDCSRFAVGLYALRQHKAEDVMKALVQTFELYGIPCHMLMDHGTPWWNNNNTLGLTWLSVALIKQGITLHHGRIFHPQTQGKVERFHRTLQQAMKANGEPKYFSECQSMLAAFRDVYNNIRPHEALAMDIPANHYCPSSLRYNPSPPEWVYPDGARIEQLNSEGCLTYRRKRYFVCEALSGEFVWVRECEKLLIVTYRHMNIRQIDLDTGRTVTLLQSAA